MPSLSEIKYSRDECISALRDYYDFLTKLYLNKSSIIEPPKEGWPSITPESLQGLGKTNEVIALLRHLPYIQRPLDDRDKAHGAANCYFADWQWNANWLSVACDRADGADELRIITEDVGFTDVPPHVIGITQGGRDNEVFLLDTQLGIVYWPECSGPARHHPSWEPVEDDPYDYAPENEAEWRAEGAAWPISDFFEILKEEFRELRFVPISVRKALHADEFHSEDDKKMICVLQRIYREHGWPDLQRYRKEECLEAVQRAMEELNPVIADCYTDD